MRHFVLTVTLLGLLAFSGWLLIGRPARPSVQTQNTPCCGPQPITAPRELDFPYYSLANGFNSTLQLVSDSPKPLDFILVIHGRSGLTQVMTPMTIQPGAKMAIDLEKLLTSLNADITGDFAEGSIAALFEGTIMPLVGQVTVTNPALGLVHESEMVENDPGRSDIPAVLNGSWWGLAGGRDASITVTNGSANAAVADVSLDYLGAKHNVTPLAFSPYETKTLSVVQLLADQKMTPAQVPEGGITIIQRGAAPRLIAQGKILDPATGFSTTLEFPDPARQHASALHASGLPIGTPSKGSPFAGAGTFTPHVIVRNLLDAPQSITLTVQYPTGAYLVKTPPPYAKAQDPTPSGSAHSTATGSASQGPQEFDGEAGEGTGTLPLGPFPVAAFSTQDISLDSALGQLPLPLPYCSIRIEHSGPPGSAIVQVSSVDLKQDLVADARVNNERDGWSGSGANPWHLDDQTESILFLTNESDKPARIGFSVTASDAHYYLTNLRLNSHETRAIDLRKLRDAQLPDFKKNKIPAAATDGSVNWIRLDNVPVAGRMVVISRHGGVASSYDCTFCVCPPNFSSVGVSPPSVTGIPGDTTQFQCTAQYVDCNSVSSFVNVTSGALWSSTSPAVATVNSTGLATALAGGRTYINGSWTDNVYNFDGFYCFSQPFTNSTSVPCDVVTVSVGCSALHLALGPTAPSATTVASCNTSSTPAGGTFSWSVNTNAVTLSASGGGATVTAANQSASQGDTVVSVTYTYNAKSATAGSAGITVHKPTSLNVLSGNYVAGGQNFTISCAGSTPCPDPYGSSRCTYDPLHTCTYNSFLFRRTYSVMDQLTPANAFSDVGISSANVQESISNISSNCCSPSIQTRSATSTIFDDNFTHANTCCLSGQPGCSLSDTQTITVNGFTVRTLSVTLTCSGVTLNP